MTSRAPRRLAPAVAALSVLATCGGGASDAVPVSDGSMTDEAMAGEPAVDTPPPDAARLAIDDTMSAARERCRGVGRVLEERIEAEGFDWPDDDEPELSEEDLDRMLAPEYEHVDGVADPDERPVIVSVPAFDAQTVPIPELDVLVATCIESDIATEAEVFGQDEFDDDFDDEFDEFDDEPVSDDDDDDDSRD